MFKTCTFNSRRPTTNNTPKGFQHRPRDGVFSL